MKNIVLFCAAGMSTSLLVSKMQEAAKEKGYECKIAAYSLNEMDKYGPEADCILLGPQVRYQADKIKAAFPDKPVEVINMQLYGLMKGKEVLEAAIKLMEG